MTLLKIATTLMGLALYACQSSQSDQNATDAKDSTEQVYAKPQAVADLEKTILDVHDSIMPAMSELMSLKKEVSQRIIELDAKPTSSQVRQLKEQGVSIRDGLTKADQVMMDWMHHYNGDTLATLNEQQAMAYLKGQQQKVNTLRTLMQKSIIDAQTYLK